MPWNYAVHDQKVSLLLTKHPDPVPFPELDIFQPLGAALVRGNRTEPWKRKLSDHFMTLTCISTTLYLTSLLLCKTAFQKTLPQVWPRGYFHWFLLEWAVTDLPWDAKNDDRKPDCALIFSCFLTLQQVKLGWKSLYWIYTF